MKILVTGAAGFIGFHLCKALIKLGYNVVGLDNINDYYDVNLKFDRLSELGITGDINYNERLTSNKYPENFQFIKLNIEDRENLPVVFKESNFDLVCNLAAQAGIRYSIENPFTYIDSNIVGFINILEVCRNFGIKKLVFASSSSVYGLNKEVTFATKHQVDQPISLYAATKKSNELMAHAYSHLFGIKSVGLRFFTVYGPWGRPDMAMFLFTKAILNDQPINLYNNGEMSRDFTFISDIIDGVINVIQGVDTVLADKEVPYAIYNIGNSKPVKMLDFIREIENATGKKAEINSLPMQPGDVKSTWADVDDLMRDFNYKPSTEVSVGVKKFVDWYLQHYN